MFGTAEPAREGKRALPLFLSVGVALLPKCPLCLAAHAAVAGALGGSAVRPLVLAALGGALALLAWRAPRRRGYGPLALGCAAAVLVVAELFHRHAPALHHPEPHTQLAGAAGAAMLVAASLWNAWPAAARASHCN